MVEKFYRGTEIIYTCFLINIFVLIGTLLGGVIFGISPSIQSGHALTKKYMMGKKVHFIKEYIELYRKNFLIANKNVLPIIIFCVIPLILLHFKHVSLTYSAPIVIMILNILFSMSEYYELSSKNLYLNVFRFITANIFGNILGICWFYICWYLSMLIPGLIPFLSIGLWIYGNMAIYTKLYTDNENAKVGE
ncbi:DUF624 domain-containing protein [Enterococcus columbae]|uniref:DUF624 domain-containing protein n=1 Tax=Enterococcus columbae DSM 7374 = ATCC 51263 TaxID=1121865 RepID=S0KYJ9_9ENTE|nr:DUF624 domain-containing protein [Enterococcus columbae]EOT44341.1 hypothetical protein OMW_00397 [Enterococcus columbae DSM 7374 = ATCC 51263]EOW84499.1 hypothetical protein I568_00995 [Enterococcus columbae DSM 7374 = ATCC 51263]OJG21011.1 hypothetical protein RR47_GL001480 [Enterococcus columbae DSM 7374 = ATCC 51263]